jgi:hypothetical protein
MENVTGFISIFMSALSNCLLYSKNHAAVDALIEKTFLLLNEIFKKAGDFEMMIIGNDLVINKNPVREIRNPPLCIALQNTAGKAYEPISEHKAPPKRQLLRSVGSFVNNMG